MNKLERAPEEMLEAVSATRLSSSCQLTIGLNKIEATCPGCHHDSCRVELENNSTTHALPTPDEEERLCFSGYSIWPNPSMPLSPQHSDLIDVTW